MEDVERPMFGLMRPVMLLLLSSALGFSIALQAPSGNAIEDWGKTIAVTSTIVAAVLWLGRIIRKFHADFMLVRVEHEMLVDDLCDRRGWDKDKLPTRSKALDLRG